MKIGMLKNCAPSQVASSNGNPFHLTKCFMMLLFLNLFSFVSKTSSSIKTNFPSPSKGGNTVETMIFYPRAFFKQETWKTLCIFLFGGSSNS